MRVSRDGVETWGHSADRGSQSFEGEEGLVVALVEV